MASDRRKAARAREIFGSKIKEIRLRWMDWDLTLACTLNSSNPADSAHNRGACEPRVDLRALKTRRTWLRPLESPSDNCAAANRRHAPHPQPPQLAGI